MIGETWFEQVYIDSYSSLLCWNNFGGLRERSALKTRGLLMLVIPTTVMQAAVALLFKSYKEEFYWSKFIQLNF